MCDIWDVPTRGGAVASLPNAISDGTHSSTFSYGANRNRWQQVATYSGGSENTIYVGGLMEKATVSGGTVNRHYVPAGSNTVILERWSTGANPVYYVTTDHLGSSGVITDASHALVVNESFGAYGARRGSNWTGTPSSGDLTAISNATRHGFTGHEGLDNLSLIHMNGRVFDPLIGRFLSADPVVDRGLGTQGLNRYGYVGNSPLSFVDPTGFDCSRIIEQDSDHMVLGELNQAAFEACVNNLLKQTGGQNNGGGSPVNLGGGHSRPSIFGRTNMIFGRAPCGGPSVSSCRAPPVEVNGMLCGKIGNCTPQAPASNSEVAALAGTVALALLAPEMFLADVAAGNGSGVTVLGSYPAYVNLAEELGANYFSVPAEQWAQMTAAEQWAANQAFLDAAIARGDSFVLSTELASAGSFYEMELQYLGQRGITLAIPPGF